MPPDRPAHRRITVTSGSWALGTWEVHAGEPHPWLQPSIIGAYVGWREATTAPVTRRQLATLRLRVIISFEGTYDVRMAGAADTVGSFVAGVSNVPALVCGQAASCAMQVCRWLGTAGRTGAYPLLMRRAVAAATTVAPHGRAHPKPPSQTRPS